MASHASLVFASVFPTSTLSHTTPTPLATPDVGFTAPGQPFGGPAAGSLSSSLTPPRAGQTRQSVRNARQNQNQQQQQLSAAQRQVKKALAWSTATQFLSLQETKEPLRRHVDSRKSREIEDALKLLLVGEVGEAVDVDGGKKQILDWYAEDIKQHFKNVIEPTLLRTARSSSDDSNWAWSLLKDMIERLREANNIYTAPLTHHIMPIIRLSDPHSAKETECGLKEHIESVLRTCVELNECPKALEIVLLDTGRSMLPIRREKKTTAIGGSFTQLVWLLSSLIELGVPAEDVERALAKATSDLLDELIHSEYLKVDWYEQQSIVPKLRKCVQAIAGDFVKGVLSQLQPKHSKLASSHQEMMTKEEKQQWIDAAIARLGRSRLQDLFDYVLRWEQSIGAVKDIKEFVPMPGARAEIVQSFQQQLHRRLLHAGATTTQILDMYIYTIQAFTELDPKGVLLDRVARPIRRYLKDRDDTTRIIIASLLADVGEEIVDTDENEDISIQIARQMQDAVTETTQDYDVDLDWNNMDWTPDPHDAGPDYRRSKTEDIISSLLSLYDREDFINELKNILGDHLLKVHDSELEKEIRLLEMFKTRLGEDKLQAAEVMLHDIEESKHINASIQADPSYQSSHLRPEAHGSEEDEVAMMGGPDTSAQAIDLSAQILSSFFWPSLRDDSFKVPLPVAYQQEGYDSSFHALKDMRRLKWLQELGSATVELELEDRMVEVICATYQASVIYAFHEMNEDYGNANGQNQHTVEGLVELLEMEEALVRQALAFWVSKLVLTETEPGSDTYIVLESLPTSTDAAKEAEVAAAVAAEAAQAAAVKSPEDVLMENMQMYRQFILGMLTNQGKMEAGRMHMMLKMVVPGGFSFSVDDLRTLLQRMGVEGLLNANGDAWSITK